VRDLVPAGNDFPNLRHGIPALASDRIQLDPKAIARLRAGTGYHHFAVRANTDLTGDRPL